ncbi:hypothetical protein RP20_CCG011393 [Aedes albopictus]|nr:hypothetical protein RP20_CCG011393 [Aedes albopictus]
MEVVEWISAILVTIVIKISWTLRQTMESMEQVNTHPPMAPDDSLYYTAYIEVEDYSEEANENENNSNLERSQRSLDGSPKEAVKTIATSTPRAKNGSAVQTIVSPGFSDIEEAPKDTSPDKERCEGELVERFCMMKMPTEEDAEAIRTTFARGKISPETEIKYRKFLQSSPSAGRSKTSKGTLRKNIRL